MRQWKIFLAMVALISIGPIAHAHGGKTYWTGREQILYSSNFEGDNGYAIVGYLNTICLRTDDAEGEITAVFNCIDERDKLGWSKDALITRFALIGKSNAASGDAQTANDGCNLQLMTGQTGFTVMPGGELIAPASDVVIAHGEVIAISPNVVLPAGTSLTIAIKNGDFCETGSSCVCNSSWNDSILEIWGIFR